MKYIQPESWRPSAGIELTAEQWDFINDVNGNITIIAGPGTGKTEAIAQKVTYLLHTKTCPPPRRILALCYKVEAAANIRTRVAKRCPQDLAYRFHSYTVDSFLISIIRRFAVNLPAWLLIRRDFCIEFELKNIANTSTYYKIKKDVSILSKNDEDVKQLYQEAANNNVFDYTMCHAMAHYIVSHAPGLVKLFSKTYEYVFWDEFQDMIDRHYVILKILFHDPHNKVCAIGDDRQAIMSFAGAKPENFQKFEADFKSQRHHFTHNHRSTMELVQFINHVIQQLTPKGETPVSYQSSHAPSPSSFISVRQFHSISDEAVYIARCIKKLIAEDNRLSFSDFAIILKQKVDDYISLVNPSFQKENIFLRNEDALVCKKGIKFHELMVDPLSRLTILLLKTQLHSIAAAERKELFYLIANILSLDTDNPRNIRKLYDIIRNIVYHDFVNVESWLYTIFESIPASRICNKRYVNQQQFNMAGRSILTFLQHCIDKNEGDILKALDDYMGTYFVKVMTIHRSKGQEFDSVFFADFSQQSWWALKQHVNKTTEQNKQSHKESLNCFFVGLSRAKKRLFFTFPTEEYPQEIAQILIGSNMLTSYIP